MLAQSDILCTGQCSKLTGVDAQRCTCLTLGTPWLWDGTTNNCIPCSGLTGEDNGKCMCEKANHGVCDLVKHACSVNACSGLSGDDYKKCECELINKVYDSKTQTCITKTTEPDPQQNNQQSNGNDTGGTRTTSTMMGSSGILNPSGVSNVSSKSSNAAITSNASATADTTANKSVGVSKGSDPETKKDGFLDSLLSFISSSEKDQGPYLKSGKEDDEEIDPAVIRKNLEANRSRLKQSDILPRSTDIFDSVSATYDDYENGKFTNRSYEEIKQRGTQPVTYK